MEEKKNNLQLKELTNITHPGHEQHIAPNQGGHNNGKDSIKKNEVLTHWDLLLALLILIVELVMEFGFNYELSRPVSFAVNAVAYILAGREVLNLAFRKASRGDLFNEFVLMSVATLGAFYIEEYSEGVAVMVFYQIGEWFQDSAVSRAKRNIKALLDIRPDEVTVLRNGTFQIVNPSEVALGETIQVKPGEKVALDGALVSESASFNTAALTGESKPDTKYKSESILAGMINLNTVAEIEVRSLFKDSKLSKILEMVQDATARKSQTQLFISRFAKVYTPIVFFLALALVVLPYFFVEEYVFRDWLYRGLVFLVISCPCALVVSIPLGYFGGIGLASRNGILFKGGNFLDVMTKVNAVVMDKTGTLTKGVFKVQEVVSSGIEEQRLIRITAALEKNSTHPAGKAIVEHAGDILGNLSASKVEEIAGHGLKGEVEEREVLAGNLKLLEKFNISYPSEIKEIAYTIVVVSIDRTYAGYITIADEVKEDAAAVIKELHRLNIKTVMLSGDKQSVVDAVANQIGLDEAYGDLLPEGKVEKVQSLKDQGFRIAFAGDGVNDAPVVALADAGIAMGGLGSDATIETADVVIQNDQPSKIVSAIKAGKLTRNIVWQNIIMAMAVKIVVLTLGAGGMANLWEAVIADVGVALLAILNAVRIQRMQL
ncbi:Cd2+/Zn2+-exporting ATPase [Arcticibacter pallidicorallinus]|uniref:P-type Zn(2+) transporter n=1 Tax=Arcticibacter pallidicorallinus TaxID=1259464 RepID=A0A2T0U5P2_9SPHI|nr:heavy metal translocating P-type ATPase [Arcticibacter pallidicorallinus]PRY53212.1 Cd2+/Zn2+-exporting ATPase [Arcticibacter pallidicorallinus]